MRYLKNIALGCASIVLALLVLEGGLRFVTSISASALTSIEANASVTNPPLEPFAGSGVMHAPDSSGTSFSSCYRVPFETNAEGFHDAELPTSLEGGIAIIGDSYVNAAQVPRSATTASFLRSQLALPVAAFGQDDIGTFGELALYERYVRPLHPSHVFLFFTTINDFFDNDCAYNTSTLCGIEVGGKARATQAQWKPSPVSSFLARRSELYRLLNFFLLSGRLELLAGNNFTPQAARRIFPRLRLEEELTADALRQMKSEVERAGGTFTIVVVPSDTVFNVQIHAIAASLSVDTIDLSSAFNTYENRFQVPLLSFSCNRHWNPLGHYVAATEIGAYLQRKQIDPAALLSPKSLLGEAGYREIYKGGIYDGASATSTLK